MLNFLKATTSYNSGVHCSAIHTYASYLKSVYTRKKLPIYDKWPQVKSKKYINLALIEKEDITKPEVNQFMKATIHGNIDDIKMSKRAMDITEIAQLPDGSQPKCILVEGAPGVGKSTFAWKLCHKWGKGKLLQQYQLVVLLRLRDKSVRAAKNISGIFCYHQHRIKEAAVEEIQGTGGEGVLLLFEGYDELPEELRREGSVFLDVITGRELPEATVLITSRPWASEFLHRECKTHISQHVEILGFTKDNIQSYLESTISGDPLLLADLKKYILCYPQVNSLMYIPLNSAIVVEVYRNSRKDETLVPKTMTELYSSLVRSLLLRHLLDHPVHGKRRRWRVCSFHDLPEDVYQQVYDLSKIAYEGILHDQQVIFSDLPENFETLGLMQCAPELYVDEGTAISYNFLHLTVQEYLAAFYLSQQPVQKQIECFREYREQEQKYRNEQSQHEKHIIYQQHNYFHMVLWFLSGLSKFSGYLNEMLNIFCVKKSGDDTPSVKFEVTLNSLHWLFEAQDKEVFAELLKSSDIQLNERFGIVTPFHCFVLGYCVSHSNCTWNIDLSLCHIGDEGVEMLVRGAVEEDTSCIGRISEINLYGNDITPVGLRNFQHLMKSLETLDLGFNKVNSEFCAVLADLIPHVPHLKKLILYANLISPGSTVPLMTSLKAHNYLESMYLEHIGIGVEDCRALGELLSSSTSLKNLNIAWNNLPPDAVELIIIGLYQNATLEKLWMWKSHFTLHNTILMKSLVSTNHTLVDLNLSFCDIDSDGACLLASGLYTNDTLQDLHLGYNPIGDKGATAFAEVLWTNHILVELNLEECNIGSDGAYQLASALCTNDKLQSLHLDYNAIGIKGATTFAEMFVKNKSLKVLDLSNNPICDEGIQNLIDSIIHNATAEKLLLPKSSTVSGSGADRRVIFIQNTPFFPRYMLLKMMAKHSFIRN